MLTRFAKTLLLGSMAALALSSTTLAAIDAGKTMEEICLENGFAVEKYTVVTEDEYILSLYRIPCTFSET